LEVLMIKKLEDFLFGRVAGRVVARLAVSGAALLAAKLAGAGINVDPNELSAAFIAGANAAYSWLKDWRDSRAAKAATANDSEKPA
jgi:hypothetical protein